MFVVPSHTDKQTRSVSLQLARCTGQVQEEADDVLSILASWIKGALKDGGRLYVDLSEGGYIPLGDIFGSLRP